MIVVYGGVAVKPEQREAVTAAAIGFVEATRAEDGCLDYILAWDVVEPNRIRLIESWTDASTAAAHTQQQHTLDWTTLISAAAAEAPLFYKVDGELFS